MDDQLQNEVILGVDTHLDVNVGAVINHTGNFFGAFAAKTSARGHLELGAWARALGCIRRAGVEGTEGPMALALLAFYASKELRFSKSTGPTGISVV